jgi:hypothetical protein
MRIDAPFWGALMAGALASVSVTFFAVAAGILG